jgi:hypothetical protein
MTLSLNCKEAGDPVCTHTMYGDTEEELLVHIYNVYLECIKISIQNLLMLPSSMTYPAFTSRIVY